MTSAAPKRVLITGASSGIGLVTAQYLANHGFHVVATSRDRSRLAELLSEATKPKWAVPEVALIRPANTPGMDSAEFFEWRWRNSASRYP